MYSAWCISWWWVTLCFLVIDEKGTLKDASLVRMFLMMQPWYIPSSDMAKKLVLKYPSFQRCSVNMLCLVFVQKYLFTRGWQSSGIKEYSTLMQSFAPWLLDQISRGELQCWASNKNMPPCQVMNSHSFFLVVQCFIWLKVTFYHQVNQLDNSKVLNLFF